MRYLRIDWVVFVCCLIGLAITADKLQQYNHPKHTDFKQCIEYYNKEKSFNKHCTKYKYEVKNDSTRTTKENTN